MKKQKFNKNISEVEDEKDVNPENEKEEFLDTENQLNEQQQENQDIQNMVD